jgi:hypothetical protein
MSNTHVMAVVKLLLVTHLVAAGISSDLLAQSIRKVDSPAPQAAASTSPHSIVASTSVTAGRGIAEYRRLWGVDHIHVRSTASGSLIRFSYRVVDADKAKILADKKYTPLLIDEKKRLALQIPVMEKIGQLRQVSMLQNGKEYWMAFSNKGHYVTPGNRVNVVIGKMRFEGLVVEGVVSARSGK